MLESRHPPASKKEALLALLDRGLTMIHLDARRDGVQVPPSYASDPHLRLNLSYRFGLADLEIDDEGVRATLSFSGSGFYCRIPWSAIFAMTQDGGERGWLWPADLPPELLSSLEPERAEQAPGLRLVPAPEGPGPDAEGPPEPPRRPTLRLVK